HEGMWMGAAAGHESIPAGLECADARAGYARPGGKMIRERGRERLELLDRVASGKRIHGVLHRIGWKARGVDALHVHRIKGAFELDVDRQIDDRMRILLAPDAQQPDARLAVPVPCELRHCYDPRYVENENGLSSRGRWTCSAASRTWNVIVTSGKKGRVTPWSRRYVPVSNVMRYVPEATVWFSVSVDARPSWSVAVRATGLHSLAWRSSRMTVMPVAGRPRATSSTCVVIMRSPDSARSFVVREEPGNPEARDPALFVGSDRQLACRIVAQTPLEHRQDLVGGPACRTDDERLSEPGLVFAIRRSEPPTHSVVCPADPRL